MMVPILIHWFIAELRPVFGRRNKRNVPSQSMIVTTVSGAQWYGPTCSDDSHLAKMRLLRLLDIGDRGSINRSSHIAFASLWYLPEDEGSFLVGFADAEEVSNAPTKRIGWLPVGKSGSDFRSRIAYSHATIMYWGVCVSYLRLVSHRLGKFSTGAREGNAI